VPHTMLQSAKFLQPYQLAFQETYRLLNIALALPVTSASSLYFSAFSGAGMDLMQYVTLNFTVIIHLNSKFYYSTFMRLQDTLF